MSFVRSNPHHRGSITQNPPPGFYHNSQHFMQSSSHSERRQQHNYHDRFDHSHKNRSERHDGRMREAQQHYRENNSYAHPGNQIQNSTVHISKELQAQESSLNNPFSSNSSFSSPLSTVQDAFPAWRKDEKLPNEERKRRKSPYARDSSEHAEETAQTLNKTKAISKAELPQHKTLKLSKKFDLLEFVKKQQLGRVCFQNLSNKLNNRLIPILPQHLII